MNTDSFDKNVNAALIFLAEKYKDDDELIRLRNTKYWDLLTSIKVDRQLAIVLGRDLLSGDATYARFFGVSLLGQICNPVQSGEEAQAEDIVAWLSDMLLTENSKLVKVGIAGALGYAYLNSAQAALLWLSKSDDVDIRWEATVALGSVLGENDSPELITRIIELSGDKDADIRDWATMHLGSIENDTPEIIQALLNRLSDGHFDTRSEAIAALISKKDLRALPALKKRLAGTRVGRMDIISAGSIGLPELQAELRRWDFPSKNFEKYLVEWAIKRCDADSTIRDSVDDEWPVIDGDVTYLKVLHGVRRPIKYKEWDGTGLPAWLN